MEKVCRWKEKSVLFLPKDKLFFNSKCKHHKTKIPFKKIVYLYIYLSMQQKFWEKKIYRYSERLLLSVHPQDKTDFLLQIITSEAVCLFICLSVFPSALLVLITNALLVIPVGQTPHLVCDHQLFNVSEELFSTDLCQWSCIWEIIVHWVYLLQSLLQDLHHSMVTACLWK